MSSASRHAEVHHICFSWPHVTLSKIATIERQTVKPEAIQGQALYVGLENITSNGEFVDVGEAGEANLKSNKFIFNETHILYGKLGPHLAKIAAPSFAGICSTDILPITTSSRLDRRYLLHYLRTPKMVAQASSNVAGTSLPRLRPQVLEQFKIPFPPIEEQRRIAAVLDAAEALRAKRRQTMKMLDSLAQAIFHDMFGDPVRNERGWPKYYLSDVATIDRKLLSPSEIHGDEQYVGLENITSRGAFESVDTADKANLKSNKFIFNTDHILYGKLRPYLIKIAAPEFEGICSTDVLPVKSGSSLNRHYLLYYLRSPGMVKYATNNAVGINLPRLSPKVLESFEIPIPSIKEQEKFSFALKALTDLVNLMNINIDNLDTLFASLQQRAFRGEL